MRKTFIIILLLFGFTISAQTKKGSIRKAQRYTSKSDYEAAVDEYKQKLKVDSTGYDVNYEYGILQTQYLHNPGEGGKYLLRAERLSQKDTAGDIIFGLAQYYQYTENYKKAIIYYNNTLRFLGDDEDDKTTKTQINQSILDCEYAEKHPKAANHKQIRLVNVGGGVNTVFAEYVPIVNKEETIMMFTSRRKDLPNTKIDDNDGAFFEDMYISFKDKDGVFKNAHPFSPADTLVKNIPNTNDDHESVISLSYNGDKFFTYRKNKIFESDMAGNVWSAPKELDTLVNEDIFQNHLTISKDNQTIYFSSERKGGEGGLDLYKAERQPGGKWGNVVSLGDAINTKKDEESPFISEDGKTLYFSSKGHKGFGGYDIYKSTFDGTKWGEPENMGLPFNSAGHDIYMTINENETHGYLSSTRTGGYGNMDIYEITYLREPFENYKADIPGVVAFTAPDTIYVDEPLNFSVQAKKDTLSELKAFNWGVNDTVLQAHDNTANYSFSKEGTYKVKVEAQTADNNFFNYEKEIVVITRPSKITQTTNSNTDSITINNIANNSNGTANNNMSNSITISNKSVNNATFKLETVYFDFNKYEINDAAKILLEKNIKTLTEHPDANIEIAAYCDNRGSDVYNKKLSKKRAKAVLKYLNQNHFDTKHIKQVEGFGESNPITKCTDKAPCTEEEYKLNRRVEFRLVRDNNLSKVK